MSHYTHENVPEEIAKRFPQLQARNVSKAQVPTHVIESAQKQKVTTTGDAASKVADVNANQNKVSHVIPTKQHTLSSHVSAIKHNPVIHASPAVVRHVRAQSTLTAPTIQVNGASNTLLKPPSTGASQATVQATSSNTATIIKHSQVIPHGSPIKNKLSVSQVSGAPLGVHHNPAAYTHENVPSEILKKFPSLKPPTGAAAATTTTHTKTETQHSLKPSSNIATQISIKSPLKHVSPQQEKKSN